MHTKESIDQIATELKRVVDDACERLNNESDENASLRPAPGKWSKKQIIGHLIDSATNNHQRFIRAAQADILIFPGYAQNEWVDQQDYNDRPWLDLLVFWQAYNHHISHVMTRVPEAEYEKECRVGSNEPCTLGFLMEDYLVHLKHHLNAVL